MIQQLVERLLASALNPSNTLNQSQMAEFVLSSDPLDLILYQQEIWDKANGKLLSASSPIPVSQTRGKIYNHGMFGNLPQPASVKLKNGTLVPYIPWDHLAYGYVLENTRAIQILRRIIREFRTGESLGAPSLETRKWIEATEVMLFGAADPVAAWLSTSAVRPDPEAVRRNAYWRMFGLDLAFGNDDNSPPAYEKTQVANVTFTLLFEELLFELWQAIANLNNTAGIDQSDDDRIFRITEQLQIILTSRRQNDMLSREELTAVTALGWAELTVSIDSAVVRDLSAEGTSPANRLRIMGERVGLPSHSKSAAFFSMSKEISTLLRVIEAGVIMTSQDAQILYDPAIPISGASNPIASASRRVITEWAAATGKNLKERPKPIDVQMPRLVAVR
jgi:hypothetical protein